MPLFSCSLCPTHRVKYRYQTDRTSALPGKARKEYHFMHRLNRCLLPLAAAAFAGGFLAFSSAVSAQTPAPPVDAPASTTATSAPPAAKRLSVRMRLGDGRQTWHPTRKQLGIRYAPGGTDSSAYGAFQFTVNRAPLRAYLSSIAPYVRRAPKDAKVVVGNIGGNDQGDDTVPAHVVPGYDGAVLDVSAAVDQIQKAVQANPSVLHIILPIKAKKAAVSTADLKGINARIGYFVTHFNPGDEGRTQTVRLAINIIDGTVVPPGGVFSVNKVVGERTAERGFGQGHVFVDGKMEVQQGGGMCQVATTLFNAAMLADLKIVERRQHVRTIPYADPGRDATVYWGQKDFKFQNDTPAPVYVSYKTTRTHAIVSLFGQAVPGRKVKLVDHYERLGERHYKASFYRVVYENGIAHKDPPFLSNYKWTPALDFSR
jgi:vancomycin resistance protein YoaR